MWPQLLHVAGHGVESCLTWLTIGQRGLQEALQIRRTGGNHELSCLSEGMTIKQPTVCKCI